MRYLNLQNKAIGRALSAAIAILIAGLLTPYSYTQSFWLLLATFLGTQVTHGTPLRQSFIYYLTMLMAIVAESMFAYTQFVVIILFLIANYLLFIYRPQGSKKFALHLFYIFAVVVLAAQLNGMSSYDSIWQYLSNNNILRHRILDISIGTLIGILCSQFVFPIQHELLFKRNMFKVVQKLNAYAEALTQQIFSGNPLTANPFVNYPGWIYEVGFNPGLRSGYRFFLIHVERVHEILISINVGNRFNIRDDISAQLKPIAITTMKKNIELMQILEQYLADKAVQIQGDYTSDIVELENTLAKVVPTQLELLDITDEYVALTNFAYDAKALRKVLLKLIMAFPGNNAQRGA